MGQVGWTQNDTFDNWDDVSTEAPKPVEPNIYTGEIVKAEAAQTQGKGLPAVKLEIMVKSVFQGDDLPSARKLFDTVTITKEAAFKVKQLSQSANVTPPKSNAADYLPEWADGLVGQPVIVSTKLEKYTPKGSTEQRESARIERYLTADQAEKKKAGVAEGGGSEAAPANTRRRRGAAAA